MGFFNGTLRGKPLTHALGVVCALAFTLQGYDQAVANGLVTLASFIKVFPEIDTSSHNLTAAQISHNSTIQGTVVALYEVGAALGAISCAFVGDILGRRKMVFAAGITCIVGIIIQSTPFSLGQLITGRVITGLGVGAFTATVPMWVSESVAAAHRGQLVLLGGFFAIIGVALATWIDFGFFYVQKSSASWRVPIAFQGIFAITVVALVGFLPESPRWLVKRDRATDATKVLSRLQDTDVDSTHVAREIANIQQSLNDDNTGTSSSPFALTENRHLHRTILAVGVNLLAQMSGVNIVTFYSDTIFQNVLGFSGTISRIISGCLQIWQVIAAGLAILLIDRFGRRKLLITAAIGMCISQAILAGLQSDLSNKGAASASIAFYFTALLCFPIGLFLLPFMYAAEVAPLRVRSKVTAMSASVNWLFNFMIAEVTPVAFSSIANKYYIVYAVINGFSVFVFYFFYPETKGRTLEEIDMIFVQSKSIWDPVRIARELPLQETLQQEADDKDAQRTKETWNEVV